MSKDWSGSSSSSNSNSSNNNNSNNNNNNSNNSAQEVANDFKEVFDWFEVKLAECNELLELMGAQLENIVDIAGKTNKLDNMIDQNKYKVNLLAQGLKLYEDYCNKLLADVPSQYRDAAQNGKVAIEEFAGDVGEKTLEAIKNYREWSDKVADVRQQMEELVQTIADLAKQKFDVIDDNFSDKLSLIKNQIDRIEDSISLTEDQGYIASTIYYEQMSKLTQNRISELKNEHKMLQQSLDNSVQVGDIEKYSEKWYDMVNAIYDVDSELMDCNKDLEKFQNSINDIYWDNFDELINRLEYVQNETENLIDLMERSNELINYPKDNDFWSANDVTWTGEGITSLGLYAQKMEIAEYQSNQYAQAIADLNKDYKAGKYSVNEYQKKLDELKKSQYESIKNYYEAQDAIVDLNKTRVDHIKDGIQKEIEAYSKLIEKRKEELSVEKDLYDFQKGVQKQQKDISAIQRKISALSGDYSSSAVAQRKKLEAELLEAKQELEETYYDRSIEDQQNALDKELDSFKEQKDEEIKKWEKYLEDVKKVIADTLEMVQTNAFDVYNTLMSKSIEYDLTLSDSVTTPWRYGEKAISDYQDKFDTAASETYNRLDNIKDKWQEIIDLMMFTAGIDISNINKDNESHVSATKKEPQKQTVSTTNKNTSVQSSSGSVSVGGKINASGAKIYASTTGSGLNQYFSSDPVYTVLKEVGEFVQVRHHSLSSGVSGYFKKSDVKAYAKGTTGVKNDQLAIVNELGDELILHAGASGKLQFLSKGSSVVPADITENLMKLGKINPQEILDRSRPSVGVNPTMVNNNVTIDINYGDVLHIDHFDGNDLNAISKLVSKQFEEHTKKLNDSLRKFTR